MGIGLVGHVDDGWLLRLVRRELWFSSLTAFRRWFRGSDEVRVRLQITYSEVTVLATGDVDARKNTSEADVTSPGFAADIPSGSQPQGLIVTCQWIFTISFSSRSMIWVNP